MTARPEPSEAVPPSRGGHALQFGFSTLGCPDLDPAGVRTLAVAHRFRFVEIRTLAGSLNFPEKLAGFPGGALGVRDFFLQADVRVPLVASSFLLTRSAEAERTALIAEAEAGEALGARWLRVFGGGEWGDPLTPERAATASAHRRWWTGIRAERGWAIDLILETHDAFSGTPEIRDFFGQTGGPMPLLWDTHHTWKVAREAVADTWAWLGAHVRHVHMKDSISVSWDRLPYAYTAPGRGEFPTTATLDLLVEARFTGLISLEWEKQWHPSLPPLDQILPAWKAVTVPFRPFED